MEREQKKFTNIIEDAPAGAGSKSIKELFDGQIYFDYPKPVNLIKKTDFYDRSMNL